MTSKKQVEAAADAVARKIADLIADAPEVGSRQCLTNPNHDGYGGCADDCDIEIKHGLVIATITSAEFINPDGDRWTQIITANGQGHSLNVGLLYSTLQAITR